MDILLRILALFLSIITALTGLIGSTKKESTPVEPNDFRVTAYIVSDTIGESFDESNLKNVTDIILFGNANFDECGEVNLSESFESDVKFIKDRITDQNLYLNILGPASQSQSDDWNKQMYDLADRHTAAFRSGALESSVKNVLEKYGFDGIVFDYEFPLRKKDWLAFDKFIISLDETLGEDYKIGMSMVGWNLQQSRRAMEATDFFEVMSYDLWDENGNHATVGIAKDDIAAFVKKGYDKSTLDLGVPFYARPTTREAYWYSYNDYCDVIDEQGLCQDPKTGLTFSFNTCDVIREKTEYALENGVGGMMVWHYACDTSADNPKSLFNAINSAKQEACSR